MHPRSSGIARRTGIALSVASLCATPLLPACLPWPGAARAEARALEARVVEQAALVAEARGHTFEPAPVEVVDDEGIVAWIAAERARETDEERARRERLLHALGVLAPSESWDALITSELAARLAGLYDPVVGRMVLRRVAAAEIPDDVLRHELVHALQDQRWDLDRRFASEEDTAVFQLLTEGEAMLVTLRMARGSEVDQASSRALGLRPVRSASGTPSERLLRARGAHPYQRGGAAVHALFRGGGWPAVDAAWASTPLSSEALIQDRPEDRPRYVRLDVLGAAGPDWHADPSQTLGHANLSDLLYALAPARREATYGEGWDGDRIQVLRHDDGRLAFVWRLAWDHAFQAADFAALAAELWPASSLGEVEVRRDEVLVVSGLPLVDVADAAWAEPFVEVSSWEEIRSFGDP